jgi:hypothetical protein
MAIIGPADLPVVLKVDSNPLKLRALTALGYPNVNVEITEQQMEVALKFVGDWVASYFPLTEKWAIFYTQPLVSTYPIPEGAYWVNDVFWDGSSTLIVNIFSPEMFLFCFADNFKILSADDRMIPVSAWDENKFKAKTPYGPRKLKLTRHEDQQLLMKVEYQSGSVVCTPNTPIKIGSFTYSDALNGWVNAAEIPLDSNLVTQYSRPKIISINPAGEGPTTTIKSPTGCFYGCHEGEPILIH